jgi:hypothetical protein
MNLDVGKKPRQLGSGPAYRVANRLVIMRPRTVAQAFLIGEMMRYPCLGQI